MLEAVSSRALALTKSIPRRMDYYSEPIYNSTGTYTISLLIPTMAIGFKHFDQTAGICMKILDPVCRRPNDNRAVLDALLSWHYEQAVLCNMRGAGEPTFEHDFPPGSDMVGEILKATQAAERMEAELFGRLHGLY